ncbi:MAG: phosphoribosylaminoimidazolesuccinocarboxamide synthase, partial [Pseudomonadota bacterium]
MTGNVLLKSQFEDLKLLKRGKVRDVYEVDDNKLLIVASDRMSAFDVVM